MAIRWIRPPSIGGLCIGLALAIAAGTPANAQPTFTGMRPEHTLWPEQVPPPPLLAKGRNSVRDSERMGIWGPVSRVVMKLEMNAGAFGGVPGAGDARWAPQGPALTLAFNRGGLIETLAMRGGLDGPDTKVEYAHQFEGEGDNRLCVGSTWTMPSRRNEAPVTWTEARKFDAKGRLLAIESRSSNNEAAAQRFTLDGSGHIVSMRIESDVEPNIYSFDAEGRLTGMTSDPADVAMGEPGSPRWRWTDATHALMLGPSGEPVDPPADLELDEQGVLKNWVFPMGPRSIRLANAVEYDAHNNWTSITTSAAIDPAKPDELKPMLRYTRTIEYFDDAKDQKPAGK